MNGPGRAAKRAMDIVVAVVALVLAAPVAAAVAVGVIATMGRPVLFRQRRPGLHGEPFTLLKFRTMYPPSDRLDEDDFEGRLTGFGRWLRTSSLDELPQLINVIRGDLSLVGPRPLLLEYLPLYNSEQARRHDVRPGLTGLAQIHGRSCARMETRFSYDVWYVDHWSLGLDLRILYRTVGYVLARKGVGGDGAPTQPAWRGNGAAGQPTPGVDQSDMLEAAGDPCADPCAPVTRLPDVGGLAVLLLDALAWAVALGAATWLRYDGDVESISAKGLLGAALAAAGLQWLLGVALRTYRGRYYLGSVEQATNLAVVALLVGVILFVAQLFMRQPLVPRSVPLIAIFIMFVLAAGARLLGRLLEERRGRRPASGRAVIVFGAGEAGRKLVKSMIAEPECGYRPVAMLDDDPGLRHRRVADVPVRGGRDELAEVAARTGAELLAIAIPSAPASTIRGLVRAGIAAGLAVKQLPSVRELLRPCVGIADLREISGSEMLRRAPVVTDVDAVAGYLAGKRVLVTGAGGSIGAELCRQIHRFGPAELLMLDRDESALHAVQLSLTGAALLDSQELILLDIRDRLALHRELACRRPRVVFHAAALKHLPMLERYPVEAWKTNVLGTANVLDAALASGVERFVNISTDKAANPISVLGRSKRIGERLVSAVPSAEPARRYLSVRFGNVLGSRGSVVGTFVDQISSGVPVTVTHPDVTRYFMTISEAVELVIQAAAIGSCGEVLVLEMGEQVRIVDVVKQLMEVLGRPAPIVYTGLRRGEKLREELFGQGELDVRPVHPAIAHVSAPPLSPAQVARLEAATDPVRTMRELSEQHPADLLAQHALGRGGS